MRGRFRDVHQVDKVPARYLIRLNHVDFRIQVLQLFAPQSSQKEMSGGQLLAALRLLMHVRRGGEISEGNVFIQGTIPESLTSRAQDTILNIPLSFKLNRRPLRSLGTLHLLRKRNSTLLRWTAPLCHLHILASRSRRIHVLAAPLSPAWCPRTIKSQIPFVALRFLLLPSFLLQTPSRESMVLGYRLARQILSSSAPRHTQVVTVNQILRLLGEHLHCLPVSRLIWSHPALPPHLHRYRQNRCIRTPHPLCWLLLVILRLAHPRPRRQRVLLQSHLIE